MRSSKTNQIVKIALLSAIAVILSFIEAQVPIFPFFLKFDLADVTAIIGAIALGPIPAMLIVFLKNILHGIIASSTAGVGELANFLIGACLVMPIGYTMRKNKNAKNFIFGAVFGIILMIISASVLNVYVLLPMYETVMNFPVSEVIEVCNAINSNITDLRTYIIYIIVPFNLIKGVVSMVVGYVLFKALEKPLLRM